MRDDILGDLQEEWNLRATISPFRAKVWYWSQVMRSIPAFAHYGAAKIGSYRIGLILIAQMISFIVITFWDKLVSRSVVESLSALENAPDIFLIRFSYFFLFSVGAILSALLSVPLGFDQRWSYRKNIVFCLGPVFLIIHGLMFHNLIETSSYGLLPYLLFRSGILVGVMLLAAQFLFCKKIFGDNLFGRGR